MARNILSLVAGYVTWTVIFLGGSAGVRVAMPGVHDADGMTGDAAALGIYLGVSFLASLMAGYLTARVSGADNGLQVGILAALLLATGIPVQLSMWDVLPVWYNVTFLVMLVPLTLVGGGVALGRREAS